MDIDHLFAQAEAFIKAGQLPEAQRLYRKILKSKPGHTRTNLAAAELALGQNDLPTASRHLKRAEKQCKQNGQYWLLRGDYELKMPDIDESMKCYEKALSFGADAIDVHLRYGNLFQAKKDFQRAVNEFERVLTLSPNHPVAQIGMGDILTMIGQAGLGLRRYATATAQLDQAAASRAKIRMKTVIDSTIQRWHFPMMNDAPRNDAFQLAIRSTVKAGDVVLDIGTGSSLLALMAADAGASIVYACDDNPRIVKAAQQVVRANGFQDRVKVLAKRSNQLTIGADMGTRADALICEIFDAGFFGEDALATIKDAKDKLLKPGAKLVPNGVKIMAQPVFSESLSHYFSVETVCGFNLSPFNALRDPRLLQIDLNRFEYTAQSDPFLAVELDLMEEISLSGRETIEFTATSTGICHGIVFWYELLQDGEPFLSTAPGQTSTHWRQAYLPILAKGKELVAGERYRITAEYQRYLIWFEFAP